MFCHRAFPDSQAAGEHIKTNRRDALTLARLRRAGELTTIWVPDPGHEAIRDLVPGREAAMEDLRAKRQHLPSLSPYANGRIYPGLRSWTLGARPVAVQPHLRAHKSNETTFVAEGPINSRGHLLLRKRRRQGLGEKPSYELCGR